MYNARILKDSIASGFYRDIRLTTLEVTFPRIVLAEFNTHRTKSRNSASSRAIPVKKRISMVESDPFIPESFGKNQKGMQASETLNEANTQRAREIWLSAKDAMVAHASQLADIEVHKELANRLLEPFAWQTVICTATEWENFFALRCNPQAQGEIRKAAEMMREVMRESEPQYLQQGQWHLPLIFDEDNDLSLEDKVKVSVARCARVSYLTHDGRRDVQADLDLYNRLATSGHMSPMEHAAMVNVQENNLILAIRPEFNGNFRYPWIQHRKMLAGEDVFNG